MLSALQFRSDAAALARLVPAALLGLCSVAISAEPVERCEQALRVQNPQQIIAHCQTLAENGHTAAAFALGQAYQTIPGQQRSSKQAARWYRLAAEQGHALAQRDLAALYDSGSGVLRDPWHAFEWYRRAALQGQPDSQLMIGLMYMEGVGTVQNSLQARTWIGKAAQANEPNAQYLYGNLIYPGDPEAGIDWYQKSAAQNNPHALYRLGLLYFRGELRGELGAEQLDPGELLAGDHRRALALAERAITAGHPRAALLKQKILQLRAGVGPPARSAVPSLVFNADVADAQQNSDEFSAPVAEARSEATLRVSPPGDQRLWLLQQPPQHYTLQLALMRRFANIKGFFSTGGWPDQARYVRAQFNSGPMYVLLYGNFATLSEAQAAISQLPDGISKVQPWIRRFGTLQQLDLN